MGGIGKFIGNAVGGLTGSNAAADAQINAANQANQTQWQMYQEQMKRMAPFLTAGQSGLGGLQNLVNNRQGALNDFYNSGEYTAMADQARYQQMAGAEATGGLGSTATGNGLAAIAPQLGQNYLNSQYNNLMGLTNMGMAAAGAQNAAGANYASAYGNNMHQIGAAQAGKATAGFNTLAGLATTAAMLYATGGLSGLMGAGAGAAGAGAAGYGITGAMGLGTGYKNYP